jgi:uncharacterized membrane protein YphA (DoxX/SURF4 family)
MRDNIRMNVSTTARAIAAARIAAGVIFLCAGFAKVTGSFVTMGFLKSAVRMSHEGFPFWRPFLDRVVVWHPAPFAWAVAAGELAIGLSLVSGLFARWASVCGFLLMLAIGLGQAWPPPGAPWHEYVTSWLTPGAYAMLFAIFAASDAGRLWGLDAWRGRRR